jgi:hypothetical protein
VAIYFCHSDNGNDANDGLDNIGVGLATATWTESTLTLTQNGHGYTYSAGDVIYISGGTGATVGLYEVTGSTSNDITLAATSTLPGVGDGNDFAAGDLATGDITSSDGPLLTITAAEDKPVAAGDTVFIHGGSTYFETVTLDVAGSSDTAPIIYRGYSTTLDDNGRAFLDGTTGNAIGGATGRDYRIFMNLNCTANAGVNIVSLGSTSTDRNVWKNCRFHDAAAGVTSFNDYCFFERCVFENLTSDACYGNLFVTCVGCVFRGCSGANIVRGESVQVINCLFYDMGSGSTAIWADFTGVNIICGNTIYGSQGGTDRGIFTGAGGIIQVCIFNNIITHCSVGIDLEDDWTGGWNIGYNNVLYDNTTDYQVNSGATTGKFTHSGEQTTDPGLVNPAADDYHITSSGSAYDNGFTGLEADSEDSYMPIGAATPSASGGGGPRVDKRGGKQV